MYRMFAFIGQNVKKDSVSESSSDIMELEDGILLKRPGIMKKSNCNPRHNNIHLACMSIETDVWLEGNSFFTYTNLLLY